jgi:enamidase
VCKGNPPAIGMVVIDGIARCGRSRNTRAVERVPEVAA